MRKRLTKEEYTSKCCIIHNNFYSYDNLIYVNDSTKVTITCPLHGDFMQHACNHAKGHGCPECKRHKTHLNKIKNLNYFLERSREKHGKFYSYEKSIYTKTNEKLIITCPIHGDFNMTANVHMRGSGCQLCANRKIADLHRGNLADVITKSQVIHDNFYDYSKIIYSTMDTKVCIGCPKHGEFYSSLTNHIKGRGCPKCSSRISKSEKYIMRILDINNINYTYQQSFDDCRNPKTGRKLWFDFYLPKQNIIIEYDGRHHFYRKTDEYFIENLDYTKYKDQIKTGYCINHNIKLIRIPYTEKIYKVLHDNGLVVKTIKELEIF